MTETMIAVPLHSGGIFSRMSSGELDNEWVNKVRGRLAARRNSRPTTKMGALRSLWPEIEQAINNGQTLKSIRDWLETEGLSLRYSQFTFYVRRLRLKQRQTAALPSPLGGNTTAVTDHVPQISSREHRVETHQVDPLSNVKSRKGQPRTFEYSPEFDEKDLL